MIFALVLVAIITIGFNRQEIALGSGPTITNTQRSTVTPVISNNTASSSVLVGTASTLVVGTTTDRVYLQIWNMSTKAVFCTLAARGTASSTFTTGPAILYAGITITASSTYQFRADENPYTGPVYCIADGAAASTTIMQF